MFDDEEYKLDTVLAEGSDFIESQLKLNRKILVHCVAGMSRSPALVMGYFMTKLGMTYENALRQIGPYSRVNDGFLSQLSQLEGK